ncbi:MAG: tRNA-dihydrouridine synthase, partial [Oscillospiraceae bacterium]|nr:tRNA-dihydrouridine synthase [Oscillospiraceae bacterium]
PVPKIAGSGCGSALLKTPELAEKIVSSVAKKISIPVSVKIRIGWDSQSICGAEFAKRLEGSGAAFIAVHGRTREQMYMPSVNLDAIAAVKAAVRIPVIANGDIASYNDAKKTYERTGCDAIMVGRAALGNPFIFRELSAFEKGLDIPKSPTFSERMENLRSLCLLEIENKGERLAMLELRRHLPFFFKGMRGAAEIRRQCCCVESRDELFKIIETALSIQNHNGED